MLSLLLDLPREIRDVVLEFALYSFQPLPRNPDAVAQNRQRLSRCDHEENECACEDRDILVDSKQEFGDTAQRLLVVNRQVFAETVCLLKRKGLSCTLDVMVVNGRELWPTWISAPVAFYRVDRVDVSFRLLGSGRYNNNDDDSNNGPPAPLSSSSALLNLFPCFLEYILGRLPWGTKRTKSIITRKLALNFVKPDNDTKKPLPRTLQHYNYRQGERAHIVSNRETQVVRENLSSFQVLPMRPERFAEHACTQIDQYLQMRHIRCERGDMLHKGVGSVDICINGKVRNTIMPGVVLMSIRFGRELYTPSDVFPTDSFASYLGWKRGTLKERQAARLPIAYLNGH